ncbi:MAG TPA: quinone oxidoreductase [Thermodesulfobacteriota bacterium]
MQAIRVHTPGGPEALVHESVERPTPKAGEALVRLEAIGINYVDIYYRSGAYPLPTPFTLGNEGAGVVEAVGEGVTEVKPGDRVAWAMRLGAYAEYAVVESWKLVPLPAGVTAQQGAAIMLQGMTAHYLTHSTYPLEPGDTCLVHAAAGGVGLLLCQMAKKRGAHVIGTVSTEAKAKLAREAGADEVILYTQKDFVEETKRIMGGKKLDVVYDSVGKDTFDKGLTLLRPRGLMALYGQSSGKVPPFDLQTLNNLGSLFVTRPTLRDHMQTREELLGRTRDLFGWLEKGELSLRIERTYPLAEARRAHEDLTGRKTTGKLLLLP